MSNAKQCDNCQELYVTPSAANDPHVVTVKQRGDWEHPAIGARLSLYNERKHNLIDDCRKCTILAVRKFMHKFGITEAKGALTQVAVSKKGKSVIFGADSDEETVNQFFEQHVGKRLRIYIEVM